jgi:aquaporin-4
MVNGRSWFAESIATFCLVFFGTISVIISAAAFGTGLSIEGILLISFAHGAAIGLMVYAFGHVSGGHINPSVTVSMIVTRKIGIVDGIGYIVFQIIGATIAAFSVKTILPELGNKVHYGVQGGPSDLLNHSALSGFAVELVLTFFLVTVVFMTAVHKKAPAGMHGLAIGGMIFLIHLIGVPLTGASVNPARTLGPAIASGYWDFHWIYWAGPIIGAVIAGLIMNYIFVKKAESEQS